MRPSVIAVAVIFPLLGCGEGMGGHPGGAPDDDAALDDDLATDDDAFDPVEYVPGATLEDVPDASQPGGTWLPPLCSVEMWCEQDVPDEPKVPCRLRVTDDDGEPLYDGWAGVELRGRSSSGFPKPHFSAELWERGDELLGFAGAWRYKDDGVAPDASWTSAEFDDSAWNSGWAPLGYGDWQTTWVSYGPDPFHKHVTTWFRRSFVLQDANAVQGPLTLQLMRDDGAIVYVNGHEVVRTNLPAGMVTPDTQASRDVEGSYEYRFFSFEVDASVLQDGPNAVAVEVHQASAASDDLWLDLWLGDTGDEVSHDFYGMGADSDWILNGNYADRALFRNKLSYDLARSLGGPERYATELVLCHLALDDEWLGVFTFGERVKRDDDRVDIAEDPDDLGRSFIVKSDDGEGGLVQATSTWGEWLAVYPRQDRLSDTALQGITETLLAVEAAAGSADPGDPDDGLFAYLDLDSAVDWVIMQELAKNNDAYFLSVHLWRDVDGPIYFLLWDHDLAWGGYPVTNCSAENWVAYRPVLISAMASVPEFHERLVERWFELRADTLADEAIIARVLDYRGVIGGAAYDNFEVWPMDEINFTWDGTNWLCPVSSYDEEMSHIVDWIQQRLAWIDDNIEAY